MRAEEAQTLAIAWKSGAETVVDISHHIGRYAAFAPLRADDELFRHVKRGDWGWCAHWPEDMEISADTLWRPALEQGAAWLRDWRRAHGMEENDAANALGVSARMWRSLEAGQRLLPKTVRLARLGFDAQRHAA